MLLQKFRKRAYLIASQFLSPKNYWNLMGNLSAIDSIADGCSDLDIFFKGGSETVVFFEKEKLINKNSITLHIGCGIGRIEKYLAKKVKKAVGVDIAVSMIKRAKQNVKLNNAEFIVNDGQTLTFPEKHFDFVYSFFVFQHMPTDSFKSYIREVSRVLKKNGKFFFQIPLDDQEKMDKPSKNNPWLMRYYKSSVINKLLIQNNFKVKKTFSGFEKYNGADFEPNFMVLAVKK